MTFGYALPDLALFAVLLRMIFLGLHHKRRAEFVFLFAWLLWAILSTLSCAHPSLHLVVWTFAMPALARAARRVRHPFSLTAALVVAAVLARATFAAHGPGFAIAVFNAHCGLAIFTGALFLLAGLRKRRDALLLGMGTHFLVAGLGNFLLASFNVPALPLLSAAVTGVWIVLAWRLAPNPDALVNEAHLAIAPSFHRSIFGVRRQMSR